MHYVWYFQPASEEHHITPNRPLRVGQHSHESGPNGPGHMGRPNDMVHYGMQLSYMVLEQIGLYQG